MSLREEFVSLASQELANMSELCRRFGISRKSGYKWLERYRQAGASGLIEKSRRPQHSPTRCDEKIEQLIVELRAEHPAWGPRKIRRVLINRGQDEASLPVPSTIGQVLRRRGLIDPARSASHQAFVRFEREQPNELWQMDYKGHVPMLDGNRCHPLTMIDDHSRYCLCVKACADERGETVRQTLVSVFERYGMPQRILCDNGGPWGSAGLEPHTALSVWLMSHGVAATHGRPYHPQTQGKDERLHRTLKDELLGRRTLGNLAESDREFERFRHTYNQVRPHEALDMECPVKRYRPSVRSYESQRQDPQYDKGVPVRRVDSGGWIGYRGENWKVGKAFAGWRIGLRETGDSAARMTVLFYEQDVGQLDLSVPGSSMASAARCSAPPPVATLPTAGHCMSQESVTDVSEHL